MGFMLTSHLRATSDAAVNKMCETNMAKLRNCKLVNELADPELTAVYSESQEYGSISMNNCQLTLRASGLGVLTEHESSLSSSNSAALSMCGLPASPHDPVHENQAQDVIIACALLMPLIGAWLLMFHILKFTACIIARNGSLSSPL